jgi:uncharacterized DUF497 family protein
VALDGKQPENLSTIREKVYPNKKKHGIDFEEAQTLWKDEDRLQIQVRSDTEPPF